MVSIEVTSRDVVVLISVAFFVLSWPCPRVLAFLRGVRDIELTFVVDAALFPMTED